MTGDWRSGRIGAALKGENPAALRRLAAGFAVIGDVRFLPGYSVLLVDEPDVQRLSDLPKPKRLSFLSGMDHLGEAVERVRRRMDPAFRRVNLEILGNTDPFLHAHVWPRFEWEPSDVVGRPVWLIRRNGGVPSSSGSVRSMTRCAMRSATNWTNRARCPEPGDTMTAARHSALAQKDR